MKEYLENFKSKKLLLLTIFSVILVAILVTQVTTALFFGGSNASSTIIISDLNISAQFLGQTGGNLNITAQDLLPGNSIARTLQITNALDSESAYVRIQSNFIIDVNFNSQFEEGEESLAVQMQLASGQTGWVQGATGPQYWFTYTGTLEAGQSISVNLVFNVYPYNGNYDYAIGNEEAGKPFQIKTKINAVQTENNGSSYLDATWPNV